MVYAAILAGGVGKRMQRTGLPKQFLNLGKKPIIEHTIQQFLAHPEIEKVYVAVPNEWLSHTNDLLIKYNEVQIIQGGADRNGSLMAAVNAIKKDFDISNNDIIVSHDAVRPFVTQRIISDNIKAGLKYGATDTVIPATDTIVEGTDEYISNIPVRSNMYQGQTPQTFNIKTLEEIYNNISNEEKAILTDACKMFVLKGKPVKLIKGEDFNIKITTAFDLELANLILKEERL